MEIPYHPTFSEQQKKYSFCFTCETCRYFDASTQSCLHEYPNTMHRLAYYDAANAPDAILFCKEYELK